MTAPTLYIPSFRNPLPRVRPGRTSVPDTPAEAEAIKAAVKTALFVPASPAAADADLRAGHDELRALLAERGGGTLSIARALVELVDEDPGGAMQMEAACMVERVYQLTHLSACTIAHALDASLEAVAEARRRGSDAVIIATGSCVIDLTEYSNLQLAQTESELQFDPDQPLRSVTELDYWRHVETRRIAAVDGGHDEPSDAARDASDRLLVPVGRWIGVPDERVFPCPVCQDDAAPLRRCQCGLQLYCSDACRAFCCAHSCGATRRSARALARNVLDDGGVAVALLSPRLALPIRALTTIGDLSLPVWYPRLDMAEHVALYQLHALVVDLVHDARFDDLLAISTAATGSDQRGARACPS